MENKLNAENAEWLDKHNKKRDILVNKTIPDLQPELDRLKEQSAKLSTDVVLFAQECEKRNLKRDAWNKKV